MRRRYGAFTASLDKREHLLLGRREVDARRAARGRVHGSLRRRTARRRPCTITEESALLAELVAVSRRAYAIDDEEDAEGVFCPGRRSSITQALRWRRQRDGRSSTCRSGASSRSAHRPRPHRRDLGLLGSPRPPAARGRMRRALVVDGIGSRGLSRRAELEPGPAGRGRLATAACAAPAWSCCAARSTPPSCAIRSRSATVVGVVTVGEA
jgi:hypothetical protein